MKTFNGADIDLNRIYVKNPCGAFITAVLDMHGWSDPVKK